MKLQIPEIELSTLSIDGLKTVENIYSLYENYISILYTSLLDWRSETLKVNEDEMGNRSIIIYAKDFQRDISIVSNSSNKIIDFTSTQGTSPTTIISIENNSNKILRLDNPFSDFYQSYIFTTFTFDLDNGITVDPYVRIDKEELYQSRTLTVSKNHKSYSNALLDFQNLFQCNLTQFGEMQADLLKEHVKQKFVSKMLSHNKN